MTIKKLFFITAMTVSITGTLLPTEEQPQERQSAAQYIKAQVARIALYLTMKMQNSYNYIDYLKSFFWRNSTNITTDNSALTLIPPTVQTTTPATQKILQNRVQLIGASKPAPSMVLKKKPQPVKQLKNPDQALAAVTKDLALIKKHPDKIKLQPVEDIEEVDSPAIKKDKAKKKASPLMTLIKDVKELDMAIAALPQKDWPIWQAKQTAILAPATPALKKAIQLTIKNSWKDHGKTILTLAVQATSMGMTGALSIFAAQYAKMATGNLEEIDTNALLASFLTYASASLIEKSNALLISNTAVQSTVSAVETNILYQAILAPSITKKTYQLQIPTFRGVIDYLIINEACLVLNAMLEPNGEITKAIKDLDVKKFLFGKKVTPTSNPFISMTLPKVKTAIGNKQLALALTEIGWIFFQSATLGGLFWASGLGYANTTFVESMSTAVLTGMAQGVLANMAALTNATTPGALITVSAVPLSQKMVAMTGVNLATTPQAIVTGVIQAVGTEVTNFLIDESEKSGGFFQTLQKGKEALGKAISSRWSSTWTSIIDAWETVQEIEPLPL